MANYLYNGVPLPDINEVWTDKETYPYACIYSNFLLLMTKPCYIYNSPDDTHRVNFLNSDGTMGSATVSVYNSESGSWALQGTTDSSTPYVLLPSWVSFDCYYGTEDTGITDTLYLAASDPIPVEEESKPTFAFDLKSWLTGFALGLCGKPMPIAPVQKQPVAYLYNGMQLPDINTVWTHKETYPYAFINSTTGYPYDTDYYILILCASYYLTDNPENDIENDNGVFGWKNYQEYHFVPNTSTSWQFIKELSGTNAGYTKFIDWVSADVVGDDGVVYIAASKPVPVYE